MRKKIFLLSILVLLIAFLAADTALASPATGPRIKVTDSTSTNWSGYAALTSLTSPARNSVTDVKGQWTVTAVSSTPGNSYSSSWVGIDGYASSTVEQIGTEADWYNGAPTYYAWYEMYPKYPVVIYAVPISPGNVISAEVSFIGKNSFRLSITNVTTGMSYSTVQKANGKRSSAEWVVEAPSTRYGVLPLANFGTVSFTAAQATINGHTGTINDPAWQNDRIDMVSSSGALRDQTSSLSLDGSSFDVTWLSS